tara:strand:- start:368 stop:808 length:441 start_codon:yes stop_codon:yes gene_type:complete
MNSIIFLITLLAIYYYIYQNYYDRFEEKYHYYFYIFIGVYIVILYIYHFEYEFFYKLLKNIYDTNSVPLYESNTMNSNSGENPFDGFNVKETLLNKQGGRCYACSNFITNSDLPHSKLKYKNPLQNGGQNNIENIGLVCNQCYEFQ